MKQKQALILFTVFDLMVLGGIIVFYHDVHQIVMDTQNQVDTISFGNRTGFSILGIGLPICHVVMIFEYFRPEWIKKNLEMMNIGVIVLLIVLFVASFAVSMLIKSKVENAGYIYCHKASGISPLARTLVYTKNMEICEEQVASGKIRY